MHPKNHFQKDYDFKSLCLLNPELSQFVHVAKSGRKSVDFTNGQAVYELNKALLSERSKWKNWSIPQGHLIPPIPGREDYIHHLADLLREENKNTLPKGPKLSLLDIGTGAGLVYPILAECIYGWQSIGSEIAQDSIKHAKQLLQAQNNIDKRPISLRPQKKKHFILKGIIKEGERLDVSMCNPPFFSTKKASEEANALKWKKLKQQPQGANFNGSDEELWTIGGEVGFIKNYIAESTEFKHQVMWFTSLVSRKENLNVIKAQLAQAGVVKEKVIEMKHGQKQSRIICWTFLTDHQRKLWAEFRWKKN